MVLGSGFDLGDATGRIILDASGVGAGVREAQNIFRGGIDQISGMVGDLGRNMSTIGTSMSVLTAPLIGGFAAGARATIEFDSAMKEISARTGLVGADLQQISEFALQMGADTVFSGQQAADAFLQLLSSGQSAEQAIATLPTVLNLAAASGDDLGRTADVVTDIMAAFNLEIDDAASVADSLARAAGSSSADVASLGQGFANVGGIARQFGLDVDQTAAILAIFAERGIKGAEAGTQLKSMLLNMTRDTEEVQTTWAALGISMYDVEGNSRDLNDVMLELTARLNDGSYSAEEQNAIMARLGGSYGIAGLAALTAGMSIQEMQELMAGQADAATIAQIQMASFANTIGSFMGSLEALGITVLTPLLEDMKPIVEEGIALVNMITAWAKENPELAASITKVLAVAAILGPVLVIVGAALQALAPIIALVGVVMGLILSPVGLLIIGVGLLAAAWATNWNGIRDKFNEVLPIIESGIRTLRLTIQEQLINGLPNIFGTNNTPFDQVRIIVQQKLVDAFGDFTLAGIGLNLRIQIEHALIEEFPNIFGTNNVPFDQVRIIVQDKLVTAFADFDLSAIDTTGISTWATTNANLILGTVVNVVGIVLGGPIGATIATARLIALAIENDFLGFGTFIQESGIGAAVQSGVDALRGIIEGAFQSLFGGGGGADAGTELAEAFASGMAVQAGPAGGPLLDVINEIVAGIQNAITVFGPEIRESLDQIGNGLRGFIDGLAGADTSGLDNIAAVILGVVSKLAGAVGFMMLLGLDIFTDVFENVLPAVGDGIAALITIISGIGEGDPGLIIQGVADGVKALVDAVVGAVTGFADPLINAINTLTGSNLPSMTQMLDDVSAAVQGVKDKVVEVVQPILDEIQRLVDWFFAEEGGLASVVNWLGETFNPAIEGIKTLLTGVWDFVKGPLENLKNGIQRIFDWIKKNVLEPFEQAISDIANALANLGGSGANESYTTAPASGNPNKGNQTPTDVHVYGGSRDVGGPGLAGMPYLIGKGAQPELFVPSTNGTFYPNADQMMGTTNHITVQMPEAALEDPARARALGRDFAQAILDEMDST